MPRSRIDRGPERDEADARDYRTSFARLATAFPGACTTHLSEGVREIADAMDAKELGDPDLPEYDNLRGLVASRNAGRITAARSLACERLHAEYAAADWSVQ
ncbi:hypothetical protein ACFHYQ_08685 [Sphaerimonospora cavernae]|uniref:Uncharacterized protein n=1 Tax=Sphaerimonospora cavernae TaxID=1740611 RepID=A0ABV6U5H7_9ACTN